MNSRLHLVLDRVFEDANFLVSTSNSYEAAILGIGHGAGDLHHGFHPPLADQLARPALIVHRRQFIRMA